MRKLLFITNGHGEDLVAAEIIKKLNKNISVSVLPVVGEGKAFESLNVTVLGPKHKLPSGGFSLRNFRYLISDLFSGLLGDTWKNIKILRELKGQFDLTIAIGDIVPIIGSLLVKAPFIFVGVNKSSYYKTFGYKYTPWERVLLKKYAQKVFVRDKITQVDLRTKGIKIKSAEYVGNPLMDCVGTINNASQRGASARGEQLTINNKEKIIIGFLPGTREDARLNMEDFGKITEEILKLKDPHHKIEFITATKLTDIPNHIKNLSFNHLLAKANLVIGLSGTGNEQAANSGIPIISFYGRGSQYNKRFAEAQKELLGDALSLVRDKDPISVAAEVWQVLRNPDMMKFMARTGEERMGNIGAVEKIAEFINAF